MNDAFKETLAHYEETYRQFFDLLARYPASLRTKEGACGDWSPQQVVAHLSGWIVEAKRRYPRYATGTGGIDYNIDAFNDVSVRQRKGHNWAHAVAELEKLIGELAAMARQITPEQAERDDRYRKWLSIMAEACQEHMQQLKVFEQAQTA